MFAALVRRDCISIPSHIFKFVDENEGRTIRLPKLIREEVLAMAANRFDLSKFKNAGGTVVGGQPLDEESDEEIVGESSQHEVLAKRCGCGRPRIEDVHRQKSVEFMETYVHSRGAVHLKDQSHRHPGLEAFTAPLTQLAEVARANNLPVSASAIRNLFKRARPDAVNTT